MILVTGSTGLVGSYLLLDLTRKGYPVRALYRKEEKISRVRHLFDMNMDRAQEQFDRIRWIKGDILDIGSLEEAMSGATDVYHTAAILTFNSRKGREMINNNLQGTANVVNMALQNNIRKLCHVSSVTTLSPSVHQHTVTEESPWKSVRNQVPYAVSKIESEREVWRGIAEGLNAVIVNPGIILGHGDPLRDSGRLIPSMSRMTRFYTSGITGMVGVRDVSRAMIQLMESSISGERFILNAENVSYKRLLKMVASGLGKPRPSVRIPAAALEISWRLDHVRSLLTGREPFITRAIARSAHEKTYFNGEKITRYLPFQYTPIEEVVREVCEQIRQEQGR
jgi:nucleoside-diphosphate-sugar epimerase